LITKGIKISRNACSGGEGRIDGRTSEEARRNGRRRRRRILDAEEPRLTADLGRRRGRRQGEGEIIPGARMPYLH